MPASGLRDQFCQHKREGQARKLRVPEKSGRSTVPRASAVAAAGTLTGGGGPGARHHDPPPHASSAGSSSSSSAGSSSSSSEGSSSSSSSDCFRPCRKLILHLKFRRNFQCNFDPISVKILCNFDSQLQQQRQQHQRMAGNRPHPSQAASCRPVPGRQPREPRSGAAALTSARPGRPTPCWGYIPAPQTNLTCAPARARHPATECHPHFFIGELS